MMRLSVLVCLLIAGCSSNPPPAPEGLRRPPAWAMQRCPAVPDIPAKDGDPKVRADYEKTWRPQYVECAARVDVLIRHVETVSPSK